MCWIEELWWEEVGKILTQINNKNGKDGGKGWRMINLYDEGWGVELNMRDERIMGD